MGGSFQRFVAGFYRTEKKNGKQSGRLFNSPIPSTPPSMLWDVLPKCGNNQALLISPEDASKGAVFYFPGCGSERMFSEVSKASLFLLLHSGRKVVLPPPFLCCGFPARVNAKTDQHGRIVLRDTIIFSQIREMFRYLRFEACVVSCGTCQEALGEIGCDEVFDCPLQDINQFVSETRVAATIKKTRQRYFYHPPCHDSLDGNGVNLLEELFETNIHTVPHCCSEAGTLSLSRPDITHSMLMKKTEAIRSEMVSAKTGETTGPELMLTNCPACLQGLGRQKEFELDIRHISHELAKTVGGEDWESALKTMVERCEVVTF
jgi:D-lactate dehydrogenase (cytochrome)